MPLPSRDERPERLRIADRAVQAGLGTAQQKGCGVVVRSDGWRRAGSTAAHQQQKQTAYELLRRIWMEAVAWGSRASGGIT